MTERRDSRRGLLEVPALGETIETFCAPRTRIVASSTPPIGMASDTDDAAWAGAAAEAENVVPDGYTPTVTESERAAPDPALRARTTRTRRTSRSTTPSIGRQVEGGDP